MSEAINQARPVSTGQFVPTFPQSLRDTEQKHDEKKPVTVDDVFNLIRSHEPINRAQLSIRLGITPQGLNTFLSQLKSTDKVFQNAEGAYLLTDMAALSVLSGEKRPSKDAAEEVSAVAILPEKGSIVRVDDQGDGNHHQPTRSLDEPTEHLFDAELTAALDLITKRVKQPVGIKPLANDDPRITAFRGLLPILADDIAQAVGEILDYVTGCAA